MPRHTHSPPHCTNTHLWVLMRLLEPLHSHFLATGVANLCAQTVYVHTQLLARPPRPHKPTRPARLLLHPRKGIHVGVCARRVAWAVGKRGSANVQMCKTVTNTVMLPHTGRCCCVQQCLVAIGVAGAGGKCRCATDTDTDTHAHGQEHLIRAAGDCVHLAQSYMAISALPQTQTRVHMGRNTSVETVCT